MQARQKVSRRDFLKGTAFTAASLTGAGLLAACAPNQDSGSGAAADAQSINWDVETDVVVVGFGGAGGAAAVEAAKAGAKVTILEMTQTGGGSTGINGGYVMLGGTALQKDLGIDDSVEEFTKYLVAASAGSATPGSWEFIAKQAPAIYDWCLEVGMQFEKTVDLGKVGGGRAGLGLAYSGNEKARQFALVAKPAPRGHIVSPGNGSGFIAALKAKAEELGCDFMYETTARHLVKDSSGRVVGVVAEDLSGKAVNVKAAKGVCLAAGGFGMNMEMMQQHFPFDVRPAYPTAAPSELGIGIQMGLEIGADTYNIGQFALGRAMYGSGAEEYIAPLKGIYVNPIGRRIVAEDEYYAFVGRQIVYAHDAWLIVDDAVNAEINVSTIGPPFASAATVEELAQAIGITPAVLASTLGDYNSSVATGVDLEFGKEQRFLVPLTQAPYYAYNIGPSGCYYHSSGGLKINLDAQVIDTAGKPIAGLYAAGRNANIAFGQYPGSGSAMLDVFTFGRIAGQKAAAEA